MDSSGPPQTCLIIAITNPMRSVSESKSPRHFCPLFFLPIARLPTLTRLFNGFGQSLAPFFPYSSCVKSRKYFSLRAGWRHFDDPLQESRPRVQTFPRFDRFRIFPHKNPRKRPSPIFPRCLRRLPMEPTFFPPPPQRCLSFVKQREQMKVPTRPSSPTHQRFSFLTHHFFSTPWNKQNVKTSTPLLGPPFGAAAHPPQKTPSGMDPPPQIPEDYLVSHICPHTMHSVPPRPPQRARWR